jgi:MFS family permease
VSGKRRIAIYFSVLLFFNHMADPEGLTRIPLLFILKDHLHSAPTGMAIFDAVVQIPAFSAVLFGIVRDRWSPLGWRDRAYFLVAAPTAAACYLWLASAHLSYWRLIAGIFAAKVACQMLDAASLALLAVVARRHEASGKLNALSETVANVVTIVSVVAGGWMVSHVATRTIFLVAGLCTCPIFLQGFWKPRAVFRKTRSDFQAPAPETLPQLFRILKPQARRLWPVVAILLLYNFSPGWYTPLFYFLTDSVHLSSDAFGLCRAVQFGATLIASAVYGELSTRWSLKKLLWISVTINIVPGFMYLLIRGLVGAIAVSAIVGLLTGFVIVALFDMLTRFTPHGLEGSSTAIGYSVFGLAGAVGDIVGASVYARAGLTPCLVMDAVATAFILPILSRLPETSVTNDQASPPLPVNA